MAFCGVFNRISTWSAQTVKNYGQICPVPEAKKYRELKISKGNDYEHGG
jgi:hypothetical protein